MRVGRFLKVIVALAFPAIAWPNSFTKICVPGVKVDLNPFRPIRDGKELAYLALLLRPYLTDESDEQGLLSNIHFSADEKRILGTVADSITWPDNSRLTAKEAATGIIEGLKWRPLGQRLQIERAKVRILNERVFEIVIDPKIQNVTGAIREALSAGARHNRVWPVRLNAKGKRPSRVEVITRYPIVRTSPSLQFIAQNFLIEVDNAAECTEPGLTLYPESIVGSLDNYYCERRTSPQAVTAQLNTAVTSKSFRSSLSSWIRRSFSVAPKQFGLEPVEAFFLPGETGFRAATHRLPKNPDVAPLRGMQISIAVEIPSFKTVLADAAKRDRIDLKTTNFPITDPSTLHAQVLSSAIFEGRHVILQDLLLWKGVKEMLGAAPLTKKALTEIHVQSATTFALEPQALQSLEAASNAELSLVPIARRFPVTCTRKNLPLELKWSEKNDLRVVRPYR